MWVRAVGEGSEIYVLDMGTPINIRYLAEQMILLSGKTPGKDIAIAFTGLRPGEKLSEELFYDVESLLPTPYPKLFLAQHGEVDWPRFASSLDALRRSCDEYDEQHIKTLIAELVPGMQAAPEAEPSRLKSAHG
jgi:FlaA1/EpsC-like NDP-sugar epimerase